MFGAVLIVFHTIECTSIQNARQLKFPSHFIYKVVCERVFGSEYGNVCNCKNDCSAPNTRDSHGIIAIIAAFRHRHSSLCVFASLVPSQKLANKQSLPLFQTNEFVADFLSLLLLRLLGSWGERNNINASECINSHRLEQNKRQQQQIDI